MKNGLDFFFEIHRAPSEIPANLSCQFSLSGQIFLHWEEATLKGLGEFQNKKIPDHVWCVLECSIRFNLIFSILISIHNF